MSNELMISINNVTKQYTLGQIGGTTLRDELQRKRAKLLHKEDPTRLIGSREQIKGYTFLALDDVSFDVKKGERVGIIGHNGAGKSTLLKLLSRVTAPTKGEIGLNGRVASMLEVGTGFHGELTGRENIYMNGAILGMTRKEIDSKIEDIIEFSECRKFIDTPVKRYSSGMYVKLAFSVAAHLDAEIMIMDEVLAVGDIAFQKKCLDKMSQISQSEGRTILYVSHNMSTIRQLCDRVIVLDHGKVVFDGGVDEGIAVYLDKSRGNECLDYDLKNCERANVELGEKAFLTDFHLLGKTTTKYDRNEKLSFSVEFDAKENLDDLHMGFVLGNSLGNGIGMAYSDNIGPVEKESHNTVRFSFDISNLSDGPYSFQPDLFWMDVNGGHHSLDFPICLISFDVEESGREGIYWQPNFGDIRLNPIEIVK